MKQDKRKSNLSNRHLKTLAKASGGTLEVHTLDELMDGTEPKTPFAKEIVAYAQKNGVDPAVAAEVLLNERGEAQMMSAKKRRALETASVSQSEKHQPTVVFSAQGTNILNNLNKLVGKLEKSSNRTKTFLGDVAEAIGATRKGSGSEYATFETKNGMIVTIRLADHNATVSNFDRNGEVNGISIVVSPKKNNGITNDGSAHIMEYYYDAIKLRKAEGSPLADVVRSIEQALYSGEFSDKTGLAEVQEVNSPNESSSPSFMTVYHGTSNVRQMKGRNGTVYGWCETEYDENGNFVANHIYLNPKTLNSNTMVHELGHLWINLLRAKNKKLYDKGISLAKEHWLFKEYKESQEYGKLSDEEIGEEVLARLIGSGFVELSEESRTRRDASREEKEKETSVIYRLRKFFKEMFKELRSAFGTWTEEEIEEVTLVDLRNMALKDIISGRTVEEWAAQEIGGEALDRLERIDRALNNPEIPVPSEKKIEKAIATAEKVMMKNPGTGSAMDLFKFWGMFFKTLFKGRDLKKAWRAL